MRKLAKKTENKAMVNFYSSEYTNYKCTNKVCNYTADYICKNGKCK